MTSTRRSLLTDQEIQWLVNRAALAPSVHNTQPWHFAWSGGGLDLYADTARGLPFSDPDGRELVISCGAALFNLRLALRKLGARGTVTPLPDAHRPRLLAHIEITPGPPATPSERRAFAALLRRRTHRGEFDDRPVSTDVAVELQRAAEEEAAQLVYVAHPGQRSRILHLARAAERQSSRDERVHAEMSEWTRPAGSRARDGVPAASFAPDVPEVLDDLPARDFDLGRGLGQLEVAPSRPGIIAALVTRGDLEDDWLTAGQALERILVTATERGVAVALHSPAVELPNRRAEVRRELCVAGFPQLLMRFGYAGPMPATPRRRAADVLDLS